MKPSKTEKPLPKSQLDFESFSLRPLRYISIINLIQYNKKACCRQHFSPSASQSAVLRWVLRPGSAARCLKQLYTQKQTAAQSFVRRSAVMVQR